MDDTLKFRASEQQIARWKTAAGGRSLSAWIRDTLDGVVEETSVASGEEVEAAPVSAAEPLAETSEPESQLAASELEAPEPESTSGGPMQPPDWRPTSEKQRAVIVAQKDRPPGFTDDEWVSLSPLARAAAASRGGPLPAA